MRSSESRLSMRLRSGREDGLTLVEVLTASMIFLLVASSVLYGVTRSLSIGRQTRERTVAASLAAREIDRARAVRDLNAVENDAYDVPINQQTYHVLRTASWISKNATAGPCDGGGGRFIAYKRVNVQVTWNQMQGVKPVRSDTIISPAVGSFDPNLGNLSIKVLDRAATVVPNVMVTVVSSGYSHSQVTGYDGCAFFAQLAPGNWTITASSAGYVDQQGIAAPSQATSVSAGNTTAIQFSYDRAATLDLSVGDATHPPVDASVALANSSLLPSGTKLFPGAGGERSLGALFPFAAGYNSWLGSCSDADPEAKTADGVTPLYPGASRGSAASVEPGATSSGVSAASFVRVVVTRGGIPATGFTVTANHAAGDATCPGGESWVLGQTAADGSVRAALPFGTWTFQVNDGGPDVTVLLSPTVVGENTVTVAR